MRLERSWTFRVITRYIFPQLYGTLTVQHNRQQTSDGDRQEYKTFANNVICDPNYQNSHASICTFHGVLMAFRDHVRIHLKKRSGLITKSNKEIG